MTDNEKIMIKYLAKKTGKPDLFYNINFVNGNPIVEGHIDIGYNRDDIEASEHEVFNEDENLLGAYFCEEDSIYIRRLKNDYDELDAFEKTLDTIIHEVAHRIQYTKLNYKHNEKTVHGEEFKIACLQLGLPPTHDKYSEHKHLDYNQKNDEDIFGLMCLHAICRDK